MNASTFPKPPKLSPLGRSRQNGWRILSFLLIGVGFTLLISGGWQYYQYYLDTTAPPPVPIVDSATMFAATESVLIPSPTTTSTSTPTDEPTATRTSTATNTPIPPTETPIDETDKTAAQITTRDAQSTNTPTPLPSHTPTLPPTATPTEVVEDNTATQIEAVPADQPAPDTSNPQSPVSRRTASPSALR